MRMTFDDSDRGQDAQRRAAPGDGVSTLLGAAMTSGLCLDLMLERLLDAASEGRV